MSTPEQPFCLTLDPQEYMGMLEQINQERREQLGSLVENELKHLPPDIVFVTVGSDGKQERHAQSESEIVMVSEVFHPDLRNRAFNQLHPYQEDYSLEFAEDGLPGYYHLDQEVPFSYVNQHEKRVYPDFLLNSMPVYGSEDTYFAMRARLLAEISAPDSTGRRIRNHMNDQLRVYRKIMERGHSQQKTFFDPATGIVNYADKKQHIYGFKGSFLRGIQRRTDMLTARLAMNADIGMLAHELPTRTPDRIEFLAKHGQINPDLAQATVDAYLWFLQQHHCLQEEYKDNGENEMVSRTFNQAEFAIVEKAAMTYCSNNR